MKHALDISYNWWYSKKPSVLIRDCIHLHYVFIHYFMQLWLISKPSVLIKDGSHLQHAALQMI